MTLLRPVGLAELKLIAAAGWRAFPPRLEGQPIFYPVLTHDYARRICTSWNVNEPESGHAGFVTRFEVEDAFVTRYAVQTVGGRELTELWMPAEELAEFNRHIVGKVEVVESIYSAGFADPIDPASQLPLAILAC